MTEIVQTVLFVASTVPLQSMISPLAALISRSRSCSASAFSDNTPLQRSSDTPFSLSERLQFQEPQGIRHISFFCYMFCSSIKKPHNTIPYSLRFVLWGYAYLFFFMFNRYRNYHIYRNTHPYHSSIHPMQVRILHTDCLNFPMYHWYMQFL